MQDLISMFQSLIQLEYRHELCKSICIHIRGYIAVRLIMQVYTVHIYVSVIMLRSFS